MVEPGAYPGLSTAEVEDRLRRLEGLLERLERLPGAMGELAMETVEALTEVYGTALARVMAHLRTLPDVATSLVEDELLHHLCVLHGVHPQPPEVRAARALEDVRPYARSHGGDIELVGIADGVARVRLSGSCHGCPSSSATLEHVVSDALLAAVPEVSRVETVGVRPPTTETPLIPIRTLPVAPR